MHFEFKNLDAASMEQSKGRSESKRPKIQREQTLDKSSYRIGLSAFRYQPLHCVTKTQQLLGEIANEDIVSNAALEREIGQRHHPVTHVDAAWYNLDKIAGSISSNVNDIDEGHIIEGESESFRQPDSRSDHAQVPICDTDMPDVTQEISTEQIQVLSSIIDKPQSINSPFNCHPSMGNLSHTDPVDNTSLENQQMTTSNQLPGAISGHHKNRVEEELFLDSQDSQNMVNFQCVPDCDQPDPPYKHPKSTASPKSVLDFMPETGSMTMAHAEPGTPSSPESSSDNRDFLEESKPDTIDRPKSSLYDTATPSIRCPAACLTPRSRSQVHGCTACGFDFRHLLQLTQQALQWSSHNNLHLEQSIQAETGLSDSVRNQIILKLRLEDLNAYALSFVASRESPIRDKDKPDCSSVENVLQLVAVPQALPTGAHCSRKEIPADSGRSTSPTTKLDCATIRSSHHQTKPGPSRRGRPKRWTELEKKKLKSYLTEEMDIGWIASQLGRSEGDIKSQRSVLGSNLRGRARIGRQHQKI